MYLHTLMTQTIVVKEIKIIGQVKSAKLINSNNSSIFLKKKKHVTNYHRIKK